MSARILLVEDNAPNRYLATFLLEKAGYIVSHSPDGRSAVAAVENERPDLVLMDLQMPEMDGYEAAQRIHALPGCESMPIVAVTSYAQHGDRAKALKAGFAGYIEKPIATDTFVSQIQPFLPGGAPQS
jgi:CheY-like chemotaxis protein